ncbi:MAG: flagellar hook-basal body complex protein FliE [Actinomycetota bacterium]
MIAVALLPILPIPPIAVPGSIQTGNLTSGAAGPTGSDSFANVFTDQLDKLSAAQRRADDLAVQAATGDLQSIQDYTIASTEAQLLTQLTVAVRNKAVEAFNDIMRMQV